MRRETANAKAERNHELFERLHNEGVQTWGVRWLRANETAVSILQSVYLAPEQHKILGSKIARAICEGYDKGRPSIMEQLTIMEYGFRASEKGSNLEGARIDFQKLMEGKKK